MMTRSMMVMDTLNGFPLKDSLLLAVMYLVMMVFNASAMALLFTDWLMMRRLTSDSSSVRKQYTSVPLSLLSTRTTLFWIR